MHPHTIRLHHGRPDYFDPESRTQVWVVTGAIPDNAPQIQHVERIARQSNPRNLSAITFERFSFAQHTNKHIALGNCPEFTV